MIYLKSCLITLAKLNLSNKELPATEYFITDTMPSLADFHVPGISVHLHFTVSQALPENLPYILLHNKESFVYTHLSC